MKKILLAIALILTIGLFVVIQQGAQFAKTGTGYMAKVMCSEIFVAGRTQQELMQSEFNDIHPMLAKISASIDTQNRSVKTSLYGLGKSKAVYRDGVGCTLAVGSLATIPQPKSTIEAKPWPEAFADTSNEAQRVDYDQLIASITGAFVPDNALNHRAILVAVDGELVYEQYAEGFNPSTPLLSWSAAKSVTATLIGIAAQQFDLDPVTPIPVEEWAKDKKRSNLTWDNLLRMESGLDFAEEYGDTNSDVNRMLFKAHNAASIATRSKLGFEPATQFYYSSGTSNILAREVGDLLEERDGHLINFAHENLLAPLGLTSTVLETDASGGFLGSSYVYATGRDWLKMGQLYLQDGIWEGKRIFPESWNEYVATPTPSSDNQYGAHFWLNLDGKQDSVSKEKRERFFPRLPDNVYFFAGRDGQYVIIIPDKNMVIVRLGLTREYPVIPKMAPLFGDIYESVSSR